MGKEKKLRAFWIFVISGILVLVGGAYSIYGRINSIAPFLFSYDNDITDTNPLEQRKKVFAELSIKDSDGDTLSDFAELYIHKTSPYIKDSDSDGTEDNSEIDSKTDPLCPTGQNCSGVIVTNVNAANTNSNVANASTVQGTTLSADQIRDELSKLGMSQDDLNKINDDDLVQLYNDTLQQEQTNSQTTNNVSNTSIQQIDTLQNLTSSEIRDLLIQNGISEESLSSISDSELQKMYQSTLQEQVQQTNTNS